MGAHDDADLPRGQALEHRGARLALDPAGEQLHPDLAARHASGALEVAEQRAHGGEVLFGQHLGRHHQRALVPALHGGEQRGQRHDGLARAHVALEQAVHRERARHVGHDDGEGAALGRRQLVGQRGQEARHQRVGHAAGDLAGRHVVMQGAGVHLEGAPAQHQRELGAEQLVEDEPAPRRVLGLEGLGLVDRGERLGAAPQLERGAPLGGERVGELAGALERFGDEGADLPARQPHLGRGGVHGEDAQRAPPGRHAGDDVDDRVGHLAGAPVLGHLPEEDRLGAGFELLGPPGLVEEDDLEPAGVVAHHDVDHGPARPRPPGVRRLHGGEHRRLVADHEVGHVGLARAVDVAPRVGREQIEHGLDAELRQHRGPPLRHPVQPRHLDVAQRAEGAAATQSPTGTGREAGRPGAPRARRRGAPRRATPRSVSCRPCARPRLR